MTPGGWVIMLLSVGGVAALLAWCVSRILRQPHASDKIHSQTDIDTHDVD